MTLDEERRAEAKARNSARWTSWVFIGIAVTMALLSVLLPLVVHPSARVPARTQAGASNAR